MYLIKGKQNSDANSSTSLNQLTVYDNLATGYLAQAMLVIKLAQDTVDRFINATVK